MTAATAATFDLGRIPFFTWEHHRRSEGLARELGLELVVLTSSRQGIWRYIELLPRTLAALLARRPSWVVVQCPSLLLAAFAVAIAPLLRLKVAIDAHNEAVTPYVHDTAPVRWLTRWLHRRAALVIVTNEPLATIVRQNGGTPFVLPDALPVPPDDQPSMKFSTDAPLFTVICTYAPDEPLEAVLQAAQSMTSRASFALTGNEQRGRARLGQPPPNVRFTGFLPEAEYWELLKRSTAVIDLTMMPSCLVCGAYEALSVTTPLILTDDAASREVFGPAALFTRNDPKDIARCVDRALREADALRAAATKYRRTYQSIWSSQAQQLSRHMIEDCS